MIRRTFRGAPGIGPSRERELWARGFLCWDDLPTTGLILSSRIDDGLRATVRELGELVAARDVAGLAARVPAGEHWRLWPLLREQACFLDIETDGTGNNEVTAVGILDAIGPRAFVAGVSLEAFPEALAGYGMLVTFNGASFDVPILRSRFPGLRVPPIHVDLRHLYRRLGEGGGLKALELRLGLPRPASVHGLDGWDAVQLWRHWTVGRDGKALRTLVEYNLYDAIQLRPLLDLGYNRMVESYGLPEAPLPVFARGDVLYDVSRILAALPAGAERQEIQRGEGEEEG